MLATIFSSATVHLSSAVRAWARLMGALLGSQDLLMLLLELGIPSQLVVPACKGVICNRAALAIHNARLDDQARCS